MNQEQILKIIKLVTIIESSGNKVISEVTGTSSLKKILPLFENHL